MDEFQLIVLRELGEIKVLCAENRAKHELNAAKIVELEKTNTRQWWMHALSPLLVTGSAIAKKYGLL